MTGLSKIFSSYLFVTLEMNMENPISNSFGKCSITKKCGFKLINRSNEIRSLLLPAISLFLHYLMRILFSEMLILLFTESVLFKWLADKDQIKVL